MQKKYQIATIANILLDMEFSVTDAFLQKNALEKGVQSMINEEQHLTLLKVLEQEDYQCLKAAGGACTNAVFAAASLGATTFVNGRVGNDDAAKALIQSLGDASIQTNKPELLTTEGTTGKCIVLVTPDAERTMLTYLGISSEIPLATLQIESITASNYFLIEGFQCIPAQSRATNLKAIALAKAAGTKLVLSICDEAVPEYFFEPIHDFIQAAQPIDLLFCNQNEAIALTKADSLDEAFLKLQSLANMFVLTMGSNGAMVWDGNMLYHIEGIPVTAVDTTGAGDIVVGVTLWALTQSFTLFEAASLANRAAAQLVSQAGPRLSIDQIRKVHDNYQDHVLQLKEPNHVVG